MILVAAEPLNVRDAPIVADLDVNIGGTMPLTDGQINQCNERYLREFDRYSKMAEAVYEKCLEIVQKKLTVRATVQRRAKNPKSFVEKLKNSKTRGRYNSIDEVFNGISDLAGVRIATYLESDRHIVVEEIRKAFSGRGADGPEIDIKDALGSGKHYMATHCQVFLIDDELIGSNENLRGTTCEIQVCSLLANVFNEIEHDLQYKPLNGEPSDQEKEFIDQLGLLTKAGDITIERLLHEAESRLQGRIGAFADVYDFIARMRIEMGLADGFAVNAVQLFDELIYLELNTPEAISQAVRQDDPQPLPAIAQSEYARLKAFIVADEHQADLLEDGSSDVLLVGVLKARLQQVLEHHSMRRGIGRPSRLALIATWYRRMRDAPLREN